MKTTYNGYVIETKNYGGGEVQHFVKFNTINHSFESMMDAMNFVDSLPVQV